ncbi:hypothetical protein OG689_31985 [Kitasatospora sp. NBC_00240]|uniref:hypothetical protein n=1 Tax=Kitasatospora sp. NBC_00240 TaxID=2903567 RepID=UPI002254C77B|nr:hypothetical protein [Kitasatospora sp. NBC_00240]MCX5213838.1 hypothetical protein [Kitasatospora sp. NBC_00240]
MERIPLICPRCGQPQRVVPGGDRVVRVVHADTGRAACGSDEAESGAESGWSSSDGRAGPEG